MSIECGICERDLRAGHSKNCPRYRPLVCLTCGAVDADNEEGNCQCCGNGRPTAQDRVVHLSGSFLNSAGLRPFFETCTAAVHVTTVDTLTKRIRVNKSARRGLPPEVCGERAAMLIDGCPRCRNHAGAHSVKLLEGMLKP